MFEKVRRCHQMLDAEDVGQRLFRHAQNVVTSVSQSILKYKMDCTIPPPRLLEGLSSAGDSGGYVGDDMVVISMWAWAYDLAPYPLSLSHTRTFTQPSYHCARGDFLPGWGEQRQR